MNRQIDFSSALYLGMYHPSDQLLPWSTFTTGKPAVLGEPDLAKKLAGELARLQRLETGLLLPSTLHAFHDLFGLFDPGKYAVFQDSLLYPVGELGAKMAGLSGFPLFVFAHLDAGALYQMIQYYLPGRRRPIILTDGLCPVCGRPAPLRRYIQLIDERDGWLLIDDTQALGILGKQPDRRQPFGKNGGGSLAYLGVDHPRVVLVGSLAKGFGVPVTQLSGSSATIGRFRNISSSRVHQSPPSVAVVHAMENALRLNRLSGRQRREQLWKHIRYFRNALNKAGIQTGGGIFPVQTIRWSRQEATLWVYHQLRKQGINVVLTHPHHKQYKAEISFLIRADHTRAMLDRTVSIIRNLFNHVSFKKLKSIHHENI